MTDWTEPQLLIGLRVFTLLCLYGIMRTLYRWKYVYALIWWPSTLAHELSHFVVGFCMGAGPTRLSALPRHDAQTGRLVLGEVGFTNLRWWNKLPVALAPLLLMPALGVWLVSTTLSWPSLSLETALIEFAALQCFVGSWPSPSDWAHAAASMAALLGLAALIVLVSTLVLYGFFGWTPSHFLTLLGL